jgi:hypothetical protein
VPRLIIRHLLRVERGANLIRGTGAAVYTGITRNREGIIGPDTRGEEERAVVRNTGVIGAGGVNRGLGRNTGVNREL